MSRPIASAARIALVVVGALAAAIARADAWPAAGGGALRVTSDPPRLVLGSERWAELRVATPADVHELSFSTSAGRVEDVRRLPQGGFAARFRAPAERVPQVAIVAATARTDSRFEDGWIAIPLSGEGDARVRGTPGEAITLRIGDRSFGPRTAGADGVATIPVVVPPGVREAHQGFRPVDLRVPEKPLLHAVQDRTAVRADREEQVRVVAYVVAPHGAARRGSAPTFDASRGTVSVSEREPGAFAAVWTLPPGPAGQERLTIRLPGAPASRSVVAVEAASGSALLARMDHASGPPTRASLLVSARGGLVADARGRFVGPAAGVVAERPQPLDLALRHGVHVGWRLEAEALGGPTDAPLAAFLAGTALRRALDGGTALEAAATVGVVLAPGRATPGARLALSAGWPRRWGVPFVEASALGAGAGAPGAFAAFGLSAGVRIGLETIDGHDPDRR